MKELITSTKEELAKILWKSDPHIYKILKNSSNVHDSRNRIFQYLNNVDASLFSIYSHTSSREMNILEKKNARDCIRVLRTILRTQNEKQTHFSALRVFYKIAKEKRVQKNISKGFLCEFIFLFRGLNGKSGLYAEEVTPLYLKLSGKEAALERTIFLDEYASKMEYYFKRYQTGLEDDLVRERNELKKDILHFFDANENDWNDYIWHLKHIISDSKTLQHLVKFDSNEIRGLELAEEHNISFQITPYYLSLFDKENRKQYD
ncbi:MAG TPA: KamA family radical SAM protein, partial [archaeon]|nr:KamA family radical SAM protein [archaeon]